MEKYLKMSGYFVGNVSINTDGQICDDKYFRGSTDIAEDYYSPICNAINTHDELVAINKDLLAALELVIGIVDDSDGVSGYHLNGDIADWGEFEEIEIARDAISKAKDAS